MARRTLIEPALEEGISGGSPAHLPEQESAISLALRGLEASRHAWLASSWSMLATEQLTRAIASLHLTPPLSSGIPEVAATAASAEQEVSVEGEAGFDPDRLLLRVREDYEADNLLGSSPCPHLLGQSLRDTGIEDMDLWETLPRSQWDATTISILLALWATSEADIEWPEEGRWRRCFEGRPEEPLETAWDSETPIFEFSPDREQLVDETADAVAGIMD